MRTRSPWALPVSLLAALLLAVLPMPPAIGALRPYWLLLVIAYWVMEDPDRVGLGFAFIIGVIADLVAGSLLGEQALRLVVVTFILQRFRARLRFFPMSQQALAIGALLLNDRIVTAAIHILVGETLPSRLSWASALVGMLLWAPVFVLLDGLRMGGWRRR